MCCKSEILEADFECTNLNLQALVETLRKKVLDSLFNYEPRTDDDFLLKFLRVRNYNIEKAFKNLEKYYWNIFNNLKLPKNLVPSDVFAAFNSGAATFLRQRCLGRRILMLQAKLWDPKQISFKEMQHSLIFQAEYVSTELMTQENGVIAICDMTGFSISHVYKINLMDIKRVAILCQGGLVTKLGEAHIVNPPLVLWPLLNFILRIISEKLRNRFRIHYSLNTLHEYVDPSILPKCVGGELEHIDAVDTNLVQHILEKDIPFKEIWNPNSKKSGLGI